MQVLGKFGAFGTLSLVLAMIGLGGVLVMLVGERRKEIGIRAALARRPGTSSRRCVAKV